MRTDGDLVIDFGTFGDQYAIWHSGTIDYEGVACYMQNDGRLVVKGAGGNEHWSSSKSWLYVTLYMRCLPCIIVLVEF